MYSDDGKDFLVQASSHLECNFIRSMQEKCTFNIMDEGVVDVTLWCDTKWRRNESKRSNIERSALFQHFEFALSVALAQRVVRIYLWIWYHYVLSKTSLSSLRCFNFFFTCLCNFIELISCMNGLINRNGNQMIHERWLHHIVPCPGACNGFQSHSIGNKFVSWLLQSYQIQYH